MRKLISILVLATFITSFTSFDLFAGEKVIYGNDDRLDYNRMPFSMRKLADSVVSLWESHNLTLEGDSYKLKTKKFADAMDLCPAERFGEQQMGAFCSGSLVGDDIIMTAGHCITDETECKNTKFVFGFAIKPKSIWDFITSAPNNAPDEINSADVYSCKHIIKCFEGDEPSGEDTDLGADYALIKLDRAVKGRAPLPINRERNIKNGTSLFVIGHPMGLPVKLAGDSSVRNASPEGYFVANLDTYGGNSGSPVFNAETKLIEGILVRGETDFVETDEECTISNVVPQEGGRGEDVTKVSALSSFIPDLSKKALYKGSVARNIKIGNLLDIQEDTGDFSIPMPTFE
ncbi:MAG: serine protease [Elusimicrobia bacterium]|nr:serine protease [Elusimicrobiota bacterium]